MKRALLRVNMELLEILIKGSFPRPDDLWTDAPADLRVVGIGEAPAGETHNWFYAVLESETFANVKYGDLLPELSPFTYRRK